MEKSKKENGDLGKENFGVAPVITSYLGLTPVVKRHGLFLLVKEESTCRRTPSHVYLVMSKTWTQAEWQPA